MVAASVGDSAESSTWQDFQRNLDPRIATSERVALASRFAPVTTERLSLGRAVGGAERNEPLHNAITYKEAFSPRLVREVLDHLGISRGRLVDPFVGVGTSLLVAAERGLEGVGLDLLPYAAFTAHTLLHAPHADWGTVDAYLGSIERAPRLEVGSFPDFPVRTWAFGPAALAELTRIRRAIWSLPDGLERDVVHLALLSIVEQSSQATKDGTSLRQRPAASGRNGRFRAITTRKTVTATFNARVALLREGATSATPPIVGSRAVVGDARSVSTLLAGELFDIAIFSPPYPNRYDYSANYQLELGFGFIDRDTDLKALRKRLLRSHLEATWPLARTVSSAALDEFLSALLHEKQTGDQTGRVFRMAAGYFEDMALVLQELATVLAPGGAAAIVVGTQVFAGQSLPTDLILADLAERAGYAVKDIWLARSKGVAVQQRARFGDVPGSRESVILLER